MAGSNYLGRAGAYAMHKRYPAGQQTFAQLKAQRENLIKARAARGQMRHTGSARYTGFRKTTMNSRGSIAAARAYKIRDVYFMRARAMGIRYMQYHDRYKFPKSRITGLNKRFKHRRSPARIYGRTSWTVYRSSHFRSRIYKRARRFHQISRWKMRGRRFTPR